MTALYELTAAFLAIIDEHVDPETGELDDGFEAAMAATEGAFAAKIESCAKYVEHLKTDAAAIANEQTRLAARKKSALNRIESLKSYMQHAMETTGQTKIKTPLWTISIRKGTPSVEVLDETALPHWLVLIKTSPDKSAIARELKAGGDVPGARLKDGKPSLSIR